MTFPKRYSTKEAATILGVSPATLNRERRLGCIRFYRPGGRRIYYLEDHLSEYIERCSESCIQEMTTSRGASGSIGFRNDQGHPTGTRRGLTREADKRDARASALRILRPLKSA
ncbi:helix-turn-helix domain-containing protein [Rhodomicrobium vannielii ATCC 17100]|nr:helix-turn-helix domain-containing protein [Rhodomicrobium vannielii ATCC 17100]